MDDTNFTINDIDVFGVKYEGSDMRQWYTLDPSYGDDNNTPKYSNMMEEPCSDVDGIGIFDKYIGVTIKLDDETNSCGNIATVKRRSIDSNGSAIVLAHNNPLLDT